MSSEVCPFCGKTFKRLKSHLPHCKAAASSKTAPSKDDVTTNQTTSFSQLDAASSNLTATQTPSVAAQLKKSKKVSAAPSDTSSPLTLSPAPPPPSAKKKKQKLPTSLTTSSPSLPPSPTTSKPKKTSLRALIEAAKSEQVSNERSLEVLPSASAPSLAASLRTKTKTSPDKKDSIKDDAGPAVLSTKAASKKKVSKTKKAAQSPPSTRETSGSLRVNERHVRDDLLVEDEREVEDSSVNSVLMKLGSGHPSRITLQDVKATLGQSKVARQSSRPSILSQIEDLSSKMSPVLLPTGNKDVDSSLVTTKPLSDQLQSFKRKQASLIPLQQLELTSPTAPKAPPTPLPLHTASSSTNGPKVTRLLTISPSLTTFSSPLPAVRVETSRADDGLKSQSTADEGNKGKGALTQRRLGQVRLRELPEWLASRTPSHPRDVVDMLQRGWRWYYKKYIDVKKGGVGGPGMLIAGYCVLSYIWSFPHIKRDRWRKYH